MCGRHVRKAERLVALFAAPSLPEPGVSCGFGLPRRTPGEHTRSLTALLPSCLLVEAVLARS